MPSRVKPRAQLARIYLRLPAARISYNSSSWRPRWYNSSRHHDVSPNGLIGARGLRDRLRLIGHARELAVSSAAPLAALIPPSPDFYGSSRHAFSAQAPAAADAAARRRRHISPQQHYFSPPSPCFRGLRYRHLAAPIRPRRLQ